MLALTSEGAQEERRSIVQYWHEEVVPDYLEGVLASFPEHNPGWRHLVFDEASAGAFIAEHLGPREAGAFRACAVPAMQADYFRYCAMLVLGGVYSDVDVRCVSSLEPVLPPAGGGHLFVQDNGGVINGFFAFGAPGHPLLELTLEMVSANIERRYCDRVYYVTGPPIFTFLYWLNRLGSFEALRERAAGSGMEEHFAAYCETLGDSARVGPAFEGVQVSPFSLCDDFIGSPGVPLPYKGTDAHWTRSRQSIFRSRWQQ